MNTLLVNSSYPPPTQSPFTNQSCLAQFEAVPFICPADIGLASAANFSHLHLGSSWSVSALSKRFVPSKRQVSLCRKSGSAWVCEFFIDNNFSQRKYSIIRRKKFVNMPEIKQIMKFTCKTKCNPDIAFTFSNHLIAFTLTSLRHYHLVIQSD